MQEKTQEVKQEIKGSVEYSLTQFVDNDWQIDYKRTVENEMAALSVAQHVMEHAIAAVSLQKKKSKGKEKQALAKQLEKFVQARMGISMLSDNIFSAYDAYKENQKRHEEAMLTADVSDKDKELLKNMMDGNK